MKSQISNVKCAALAFAALSLSAGVGLWYGYRPGVATLVVTPRQYVPVMPGATTNFTAVAWWDDAHGTNVSADGTTWQCSPAIGTMATNALSATNAQPVFGWVQATYGGLATRVYVKVTPDGFWNPDADSDGDGLSDAQEIASNTSPAQATLLGVECRLYR